MADSSLENPKYLVFTFSEAIIKSLKESILTGVSKICYEEGRYTALIRLFILLLCAAGFCSNTWQFLLLYVSYPTYTVTTIVNEGDFALPAFTFCNRSPGSRRFYCMKYREECYRPENMREFCSLYRHYCFYNTDDFWIPKNPIIDWENRTFFTPAPFLSHSETKNYDVSRFRYKRNSENLHCTSTSTYGRVRPPTDESDANTFSNQTINIRRNYLGTFSIYLDYTETLSVEYPPVVLLGLHSATDAIFSEFEIELRSSYDVHIRLEEHVLLPAPYVTNCRNYTQEALNNNFTGPTSKTSCVLLCGMQPYLETCGCAPWSSILDKYIIPPEFLCKYEVEHNCTTEMDVDSNEIEECYASCKDDCVKRIYRAEVANTLEVFSDEYISSRLYVKVKQPLVVRTVHKPKFQIFDLFRCIGGYLAFWMGMTLVSIADLLVSLMKNTLGCLYQLTPSSKTKLF